LVTPRKLEFTCYVRDVTLQAFPLKKITIVHIPTSHKPLRDAWIQGD
jgi:hypothetical protein